MKSLVTRNDDGYILILVLVVVCVITLAVIGLMNRTTQASFLAVKRSTTVQAFPLAESAALEGFWYLKNDAYYRTNQERHWGNNWYRFSIIDSTPLDPSDDLNLEVLGEGFAGNQQRGVRLYLSRPDLSSNFEIDLWREDN